jgi:hypothetical protein
MPAKAAIQNTTTLAEFRLLATPASRKPCAAASGPAGYLLSRTAFAGIQRAYPNAVFFVSCQDDQQERMFRLLADAMLKTKPAPHRGGELTRSGTR